MTPDVIRKSIFKENFKHEDIDPDLLYQDLLHSVQDVHIEDYFMN